MDPKVKNRLNMEKKIKSKLVQTRKIIRNKFQRAYKDRIRNERKLHEKYKPITSEIKKLHKQKADACTELKQCNTSEPDSDNINLYGNDDIALDWDMSDHDDNWDEHEVRSEPDWDDSDAVVVSKLPSKSDEIPQTASNAGSSSKSLHSAHHHSTDFPAVQRLPTDNIAIASTSHTPKPMDFLAESAKRSKQNLDQLADSIPKRSKTVPPSRRRLDFQARNIHYARKIREDVSRRTDEILEKLRQKDHRKKSRTSKFDVGKPSTSKNNDLPVDDNLASDDEEEFVLPNTLRTAEKRRKHQKFEKNKLVKIPSPGEDVDDKIRAKHGLSKKFPKVLLAPFKKRTFPTQNTPYLHPHIQHSNHFKSIRDKRADIISQHKTPDTR